MRGTTQMLGVVMTINAIKHRDRYAEKAGRLPFVVGKADIAFCGANVCF